MLYPAELRAAGELRIVQPHTVAVIVLKLLYGLTTMWELGSAESR